MDSEIDFDHHGNITADRQTLYCVPIPGETPWVKAVSSLVLCKSSELRIIYFLTRLSQVYQREASSAAGMAGHGEMESVEDRPPKRRLSQSDEEDAVAVSKKLRDCQSSSTSAPANQLITDSDLNLPLPWEKGTPCLVKVSSSSSSTFAELIALCRSMMTLSGTK